MERRSSTTRRGRLDLAQPLPLAAARLKARVDLGRGIELTTVLTGRRRTQTQVTSVMLRGRCPGASHYVSAMDLGAVALHQTSAVQTEAGASVAGVGAGASNAKRQSAFAGRGDPEACKAQGLGTGCNIPFRINK